MFDSAGGGIEDWQPLVDTQCCLRCSFMALIAVGCLCINFASIVYGRAGGVPIDYIAAGEMKSMGDMFISLLASLRDSTTSTND